MESPFQNILHTNTVPTDAQVEEIRAFLDPHRLQLTELDKEVHRLAQLLNEATNRRDELQGMITSHETLVAPMRRVPDDVLRVIFVHTLPERRNTALDSGEGPLLLSRVCKYWRELALTTPRLWASMHLVVAPDAPDDWRPSQRNFQELLHSQMEIWLERSAAVPLVISMHISFQRYAPPVVGTSEMSSLRSPRLSPFLSALLGAVKRWGSIQLNLSLSPDITALSMLTEDDVPCLKSFDLALLGPLTPEQSQYGFKFLATDSLRRFSFAGMYDSLPVTLPWRNLLVLHIRLSTSFDQTLAPMAFPFPFLQECTLLETLVVTTFGGHPQLEETARPLSVHLPNLTALNLAIFDAFDVSATSSAVHTLNLPALDSLDVSRGPVDLMTLLQPMGHIKCLAISVDALDSDYIVSVLHMLPLLERLRLVGVPGRPSPVDGGLPPSHPPTPDLQFLAHFIPKHGADILCPALYHLEFTLALFLSDELILRFLRSRTLPDIALYPDVAAISRFNCFMPREPEIDICAQLSDAISDGLKLCLTYKPPAKKFGYSPLEGTERGLGPHWHHQGDDEDWLQNFSPNHL
ncbi:hypothetical protein C8F01DRAFT_1122875 [Mycena amicta]|nr:hypothetical protein C8F01DRAFT_1122875 [Mycena amicta]